MKTRMRPADRRAASRRSGCPISAPSASWIQAVTRGWLKRPYRGRASVRSRPERVRICSRFGWPGSTSPVGRDDALHSCSAEAATGRGGAGSPYRPCSRPARSAGPRCRGRRCWPASPRDTRCPVIAPLRRAAARPSASTRTSEPTAKAAWSAADCFQLRYPASASVVVAVATTTSRTGPAWRIGRLADLQLTRAAASRRAAVGRLVGQPGEQRQPAERDERHPGQRECGGDGDHRIDPERSRGRMRDRRIAAQFPYRDRGQRHEGQIAACPGDPREPGLPALAPLAASGSRRAAPARPSPRRTAPA